MTCLQGLNLLALPTRKTTNFQIQKKTSSPSTCGGKKLEPSGEIKGSILAVLVILVFKHFPDVIPSGKLTWQQWKTTMNEDAFLSHLKW